MQSLKQQRFLWRWRGAIAGIGFMGVRAWEIFCHGDRLFGITAQTQKFLGMTEPTV